MYLIHTKIAYFFVSLNIEQTFSQPAKEILFFEYCSYFCE